MKLLILEDDHDLGSHWCQMLEASGHHVIFVQNADHAIEQIVSQRFDVVITDVLIKEQGVLASRGGLTLLSKINFDVKPRPYVIVVSGADPAANIHRHAELLCADRTLVKPIAAAELVEMVNALDLASI